MEKGGEEGKNQSSCGRKDKKAKEILLDSVVEKKDGLI